MDNHLEHFGILGQKWGVRRFQNEDGSLTEAGKARYGVGKNKDWKRLNRDAAHDAKEYARAKAYYGEGAGNRRKQINNLISERMKDPDYKREFERQLSIQNMEKHQKAASRERNMRDTSENVSRFIKKTIGVGVTLGSLALAASPSLRQKAGEAIIRYGKLAMDQAKIAKNAVQRGVRKVWR